jgi:hypothetical protein
MWLFKGGCDNGELTASLYKGNNNHSFRTYFLVVRKLRTTVKCNLLIIMSVNQGHGVS